MSTFTIGKSSPNQSGKNRQQVAHDDNCKRRTLLQDSSWIKKRPEEESTNENYGRVVLNQYKSQDSLNSNLNEKEDQKVLLGRYRSDTTLDRISDTRDADKANNSPRLENRTTDRQSWTPSNTSATTTTSPVKPKRQSWMPPPVSGYKNTTVTEENKGQSRTLPDTTTTTIVDAKRTIYSSEQTTPERSKTAVDNQTRTRSQDQDNLKKNPTTHTNDKGGKDLDDLTVVNTAAQKNKRGHDLDDRIEVKAPEEQNKNWTTEQPSDSANAPNNRSDTNYFYDNRGSSNNTSTSYSSPKDKVVYTRTYEETRYGKDTSSKSPNDAYEENVAGKSIKTVYSTSDRSIIEKDMCTYCRKPLGIDSKMILDALQICCHSTCFKCEVCKRPLEDLKAGDSIWIYRNTVHCEPCYFKIKEKWIY
ncbi:sciellin isoform X2 [Dermochelys coriacea]|uniref:sciellin isoform X2 n=1 Tax=Dermochelys coriacea TaxID=27794 RepID=UPI0018E878AE|nr:sciellin isoform X2 [Dermochelys coriacea]XP_038243581.1 sciellin isoform X2 [Dermochelys coriacea]XP_043360579.1 sciellin isoform X2 [Dermochelys coriacea]